MKEETIEQFARRTGAAARIRDLHQPAQPQGQAPAGSPPDINYKLHYTYPNAARHLGLTPPLDTQLPPAPQGKDKIEYDGQDRPWNSNKRTVEAWPEFGDPDDPWAELDDDRER